MSCYATLSSHVQKAEFPDNGPSDFKARLPKDRLWQEDDGWEVGLSGASFPIIPPPEPGHPEKILVHQAYHGVGHPETWKEEGYLCTYYYSTTKRRDNGRLTIDRSQRGVILLSEITPSKTGVEFIQKILHRMDQKIRDDLRTGEHLHFEYWSEGAGGSESTVERTERTTATFAWDGDDLILDNTEVFKSGIMWKYFGWVYELALHMGWLKITVDGPPFLPGHYEKGDNLIMEPIDPKAPMPDYGQEQFRDGSVFQEYPNDFSDGPVQLVTEGVGWSVLYQGAHFMVMAKAFNWRFVRLNDAFAKLKQTPLAVQTIERPLFVYVNLVESQWLEESYDELLRTVPYKSGGAWWEPRQVHYHRLRGSTIETAHVRVTEVNGRPVTFPKETSTTLCLHFRRRRRHGSCRFTQ